MSDQVGVSDSNVCNRGFKTKQALNIHKSKHRRENMKNVNIEHKKDFKAPSKLPPETDADFTEKFKLYYDNINKTKDTKKTF